MSHWEKELIDGFLADVPEDGVDALVSALSESSALGESSASQSPVSPPSDLRARLLGAARHEGRFARFAAQVAELLDIDEGKANALLDGIAVPDNWYDSPIEPIRLYDLEGGPKVQAAIRGFVSMPAGSAFPEHEHLGTEHVLVVQGSFEDSSGAVHHPGDVVRMEGGTSHAFTVRPGPDLVYMFVGQGGVKIGDMVFGPDTPDL
ncbi:MAG: cupin domain-containing protein [Sandaracinaceae bacterium]